MNLHIKLLHPSAYRGCYMAEFHLVFICNLGGLILKSLGLSSGLISSNSLSVKPGRHGADHTGQGRLCVIPCHLCRVHGVLDVSTCFYQSPAAPVRRQPHPRPSLTLSSPPALGYICMQCRPAQWVPTRSVVSNMYPYAASAPLPPDPG